MNVWLMKTFKSWAGIFLTSKPNFVGIDEDGIDINYGNLNPNQRTGLFAHLQITGTASSQFGLIKRFFDDFYDEMAVDDIIVLGVGQRTQFQVVAILNVTGSAAYLPNSYAPCHVREVKAIWTGTPYPVDEWGYSRRLEKLDTIERYQVFIRVFTSLVP